MSKHTEEANRRSGRKTIVLSVLAVILVVGGYFTYRGVHFYTTHAETEDAQIDGHISPVLPRISGYVADVRVDDNEYVKEGQLLAEIDSSEFVMKKKMAKAALESTRAAYEVAKANLNSAKVGLDKAKRDYKRAKELFEGGADTRQKYEDAQAALAKARTAYAAADRKVSEIKTRIQQRREDLEYAKLQLSYTKIHAPISGLISKKDVEVGQLVQAGQPLMAVTNTNNIWVIANYKETELNDIKPGQIVKISVDAYPGKNFEGRVESVAGATGAKYALLPPDNATGNFVKVVQRVPVKIVFTKDPGRKYPMHLGLNVVTSIDITQDIPEQAKFSARRE